MNIVRTRSGQKKTATSTPGISGPSRIADWGGQTSLLGPNSAQFEIERDGEDTALNMFPTSLFKQFIAWEGEAPAEPLHCWLGRSLALPSVFNGPGIAENFGAVRRSLHGSAFPGVSLGTNKTNHILGRKIVGRKIVANNLFAFDLSANCLRCRGILLRF